MAEVVIAIGSNLGDRTSMLREAATALKKLSRDPVEFSSAWESAPVGPAKYPFLNSVAILTTELLPIDLLHALKNIEKRVGRDPATPRWGPRLLDLDIISWGRLAMDSEKLIIPHPEYRQRLFVLLPLQELRPEWADPMDQTPIRTLITQADPVEIEQTDISWTSI
ncbi:MAG: 2-amino-4-hydroxy-6-hydroxymethyldihydropteridine diphosphokinase [Balneolaceae bacterium]